MSKPNEASGKNVGEESLRESERRLRYAVLANQAQVWEWRVAEGRVFRTDFTSRTNDDAPMPQWQDLESWFAGMHPDDAPKVAASLDECLSKKVERIRVQYRMRVGEVLRWFEVVGIEGYRRSNGDLVQMLGTESDITEPKRVQELLTSAQKRAEEANRTKTEFLANMSHEVRTPLNAVIGLTRLLRKTQLSDQQSTYLDMIDSSAKSLLTILNDVLDLSKIEAGRMTLDEVDFNLRDWLDDAVLPYMTQVHEKGLTFDVRVSRSVPNAILSDPVRLRQIVTNLVSNAVRFTKTGGITVEVKLADPHAHRAFDASGVETVQLHLAVRDTGVGISSEARERIFQAFEQADASTTRRYGGTGLGLAISQRLAAMFGSEIHVTSTPGEGSTFEMTADFIVSSDAQSDYSTQPMPVLPEPLAGQRVLVAEDNPINQMLVRQMLEELHVDVTMVADGEQALLAWQQQAFDLILMDIQMPVMGGDEAVRHIRKLEAGHSHRTPIIAMTAHALTGDRERYLEIGMDSYVSKPMSPQSLLLGIQEATVRSQVDVQLPLIERMSLTFDA